MGKYIDSEKLIAEIRQHIHDPKQIEDWRYRLKMEEDNALLERIISIITSLQQEPRFPQYDNIVEKIFGAGNLDGWERDEAEMLVALAKEELLKSLQQEQSDIKSPFTGGKVIILSREEETTFRGEK